MSTSSFITTHPLSKGYAPVWACAWGQDEYGPFCAFRIGDVEQNLRWIPPGVFRMGSSPDDSERIDREEPRHPVRLSQGFWLFDTPCTQGLWEAVMGENPSRFQGTQRPVENVSWADCQAFIAKLNEKCPGLHLRLPTEAEWERACRAGTQGPRYETELDAIAWYTDNSDGETHDVSQKRPNAWGLYDMLGNVDEWCHDGLRDYEADLVIDPVGPTDTGAYRVFRGGAWDDSAQYARAANRRWSDPGYRVDDLGFRCLSSESEPRSGGT